MLIVPQFLTAENQNDPKGAFSVVSVISVVKNSRNVKLRLRRGAVVVGEGVFAHLLQELREGADLLGKENVRPIHKTLGAEDFGEFMKFAPGAMYTLGTHGGDGTDYPLHHPRFDIDESALPAGAAVMCTSVYNLLGGAQA